MLSVCDTWREYFRNHDEGLGTTYERFILHRYFREIRERFEIKNIIEVPSFGMTGISGINSMWWALQGVNVTIVDELRERLDLMKKVWSDTSLTAEFVECSTFGDLPFMDATFDMSWNFASLWFVPALETFFNELNRITRRVVFICVPNRLGVGFVIRRMFGGKKDDGLRYDNISPGRIKNGMRKRGWSIFEEGYFDVPPWPDIAMKKEDLLKKMGLSWLAKKTGNASDDGMCILDYYRGENKEMDKAVLKYAFLEASPQMLKRFWAHHWYVVFTR